MRFVLYDEQSGTVVILVRAAFSWLRHPPAQCGDKLVERGGWINRQVIFSALDAAHRPVEGGGWQETRTRCALHRVPEQWPRGAEEKIVHAVGFDGVFEFFDVDSSRDEYVTAAHQSHVIERAADHGERYVRPSPDEFMRDRAHQTLLLRTASKRHKGETTGAGSAPPALRALLFRHGCDEFDFALRQNALGEGRGLGAGGQNPLGVRLRLVGRLVALRGPTAVQFSPDHR